jgi:hypothetical protein
MEKEFFTNCILRDNLLPYIQVKFPDVHRLQQDNDPKHRSKMAKDFMRDNNVWQKVISEDAVSEEFLHHDVLKIWLVWTHPLC